MEHSKKIADSTLGHTSFGIIRDAGFTKSEIIDLLNAVSPISQPTFDKRLKDGQWLHSHVAKLNELGLWVSTSE